MKNQDSLRKALVDMLEGGDAHLEIQDVVDGTDPDLRSRRPESLPYSVWDLIEHIRIAQEDLIEFGVNPDYEALNFPDDYWPEKRKSVPDQEWYGSIETIQNDRDRMIEIVMDSELDLLKPIPHGNGQTLFRQAMLLVDHRSYHLGQIVAVRRELDDWQERNEFEM